MKQQAINFSMTLPTNDIFHCLTISTYANNTPSPKIASDNIFFCHFLVMLRVFRTHSGLRATIYYINIFFSLIKINLEHPLELYQHAIRVRENLI